MLQCMRHVEDKRTAPQDKKAKRQKLVRTNPSDAALQASQLHTEGYVVYRDAVRVPKALVKAIENDKSLYSTPIFNHEIEDADKRLRLQCPAERYGEFAPLKKQLVELLKKEHHVDNRKAAAWKIVESKAGCAVQPAHCDLRVDAVRGLSDAELPLFVLVALYESQLHVWPNSIRLLTDVDRTVYLEPIKRQTLELHPGDVVVCRVDLVHAGAAYEEFNARLHGFLDSKSRKAPSEADRDKNYIVKREDPRLARVILE